MDTAAPWELDMEIVRDVLRWAAKGGQEQDKPSGHDALRLAAHVEMMVKAGLIEGEALIRRKVGAPGFDVVSCLVRRPTLGGAQTLKGIEDDTIWAETKAKAKELGLPLLLDLVVKIAVALAAARGFTI